MKFKEKPQLPTTLHQAHRIIRMITREREKLIVMFLIQQYLIG